MEAKNFGKPRIKAIWMLVCLGLFVATLIIMRVQGSHNHFVMIDILLFTSPYFMIALGMGLTFAAGSLDLSQYGIASLCSFILAFLLQRGMGEAPALLLMLLAAALMGGVCGVIAFFAKKHTRLITGIATLLLGVGMREGIRRLWDPIIHDSYYKLDSDFFAVKLSRYQPLGIPAIFIVCVVILILFCILYADKDVFLPRTAPDSGKDMGSMRLVAGILSGLLAGIGCFFYAGRLASLGCYGGFSDYFAINRDLYESKTFFSLNIREIAALAVAGIIFPNLTRRKSETVCGFVSILLGCMIFEAISIILTLSNIRTYDRNYIYCAIFFVFAIIDAILYIRFNPVEKRRVSPNGASQTEGGTVSMEGYKSKTTAIILSILLGGLGIDRFYLGYTGLGVLKLLTIGGFGIWALIDIIMICTGSLKPADGSPYREDASAAQPLPVVVSKSSSPEGDSLDAIAKLNELYRQGILTQEEFEEKKKSLLDRL